MKPIKRVLVTGGAGYVGAILVPKLLSSGYQVRVLDTYWFGEHVFDSIKGNRSLEEIKGDIRDQALVKRVVAGCGAVIHLACVANDPSFELNPALSKAINFDAIEPLVKISKASGVHRFVYASTSSVYGISDRREVTEDHPLVPLTDYNKYKGLCEPILLKEQSDAFTTVVIRPATVCGYSPRQRLDLSVNILTNHAVNLGRIIVFGGGQMRPNIHIEDISDFYVKLLEFPDQVIAGQIFNAGYENKTIAEIAETVRQAVLERMPERRGLTIETTDCDDRRSYHICSTKAERELGFAPKYSVRDAVFNLMDAFQAGQIPDPATDPRYYNIKTMQALNLG